MPISWQVAMMRTAISPRLAIRIFLNMIPLYAKHHQSCPFLQYLPVLRCSDRNSLCIPARLAFFQKGLETFLAFLTGAQAGNSFGSVAASLILGQLPNRQRQGFAGAQCLGSAGQEFGDGFAYSIIELLKRHHGVNQADMM